MEASDNTPNPPYYMYVRNQIESHSCNIIEMSKCNNKCNNSNNSGSSNNDKG